MPAALTFPGVYVDEVPSGGARPIAAAPTSIGAFVGPVPKGPTDVRHITSWDDFERLYGAVDAASPLSVAVYQFFLNGGAEAKIVRVLPAGAKQATMKLGADADNVPELLAASPGAWGKSLRARVDYTPTDLDPTDEHPEQLYNLTVRDVTAKQQERFTSISIDPKSKRSIDKVLAASKLVAVAKDKAGADRPAANPQAKDGTDPFADVSAAKSFYKAANGTDGGAQAAPDYVAGFKLLRLIGGFNILCVLPAVHGGDVEAALPAAGRLCIDKRAFLLVDPPAAWKDIDTAVTGVVNAHPLTGTEFAKSAAVYFPRLTIADPTPTKSGEIPDVAPCGAVAGLFARTDVQRGVWKAPAGTGAGFNGVNSFGVPMTDPENGRLNPLGVNCLRSFPGLGRLSWGARTMAGGDAVLEDPSWRYVPIRRLALFIEESLYVGTKWVVFEPNDGSLWSSIRLSVGAFMNRLFRQGAFQGRTPKDAFLVKCDRQNNLQEDIDRGIVNILVGFAPLKPAEFVLLHIQQLPGDVQT